MATITTNQPITAREPRGRISVPVGTGLKIPQGTLVFAIAATGYATNAIAAGANHFLGVAVSEADNTAGADGAINVEVYTQGIFQLVAVSGLLAWVGDKIYAIDNGAVDATATSQTLVGHCVEYVSATKIGVQIKAGVA